MSKTLVGVGPYVDWLEAVPIESVATSPQIPSLYVVDANMGGGMSSKQLQLTAATTNFASAQAAFITEVASTLSSGSYTVQEKFVFITAETVSGSNTALTVQVVGQVDPAGMTALQAKTNLGGLAVSNLIATDQTRTNRCLGNTPLDVCAEDPIYSALKTSREAMTGVYSTPSSELETCAALHCKSLPEVITTGILVTFIVLGTFFILARAQAVHQGEGV